MKEQDSEQLAELRSRARAVTQSSTGLGEKYFALCEHIRENRFAPIQVSTILKAEGFRKERISEIKTVCFTSPEIWQDYKNRFIGFKVALSRTREERIECPSCVIWNGALDQLCRAHKKAKVKPEAQIVGHLLVMTSDVDTALERCADKKVMELSTKNFLVTVRKAPQTNKKPKQERKTKP